MFYVILPEKSLCNMRSILFLGESVPVYTFKTNYEKG